MNKLQNDEIWGRLLCGKSMGDLQIVKKDGRLDLSGLSLPEPEILRRFQTSIANVTQFDTSRVKIRNAKWSNLDFTGSKLQHVLFFNCSMANCVFDQCDCRHWRLWDCAVAHSSFKGADLREAALGGVGDDSGEGCSYEDVDFSEADMRGTIHKTALFERCLFRHAELSKIDFQGSRFVDCIFEGELNDVVFYRKSFRGGDAFPPNEMLNVDFSRARLRHVGFRGLNLDRVHLPQDSEHIVIKSFTSALDRMVEVLSRQEDTTAKKLVAFIGIKRKWAAPNQAQGVINVADLADVVGEDGVKRFIAAIPL
jgi:uncharacterized protein YjbI with pentapeptide repeats